MDTYGEVLEHFKARVIDLQDDLLKMRTDGRSSKELALLISTLKYNESALKELEKILW